MRSQALRQAYNNRKDPHPFTRFMSLYGMEVAPAEECYVVPAHPALRDGLPDSSGTILNIEAGYMAGGWLQSLIAGLEPAGGTAESAVSEAMMAAFSDVQRILNETVVALDEYT